MNDAAVERRIRRRTLHRSRSTAVAVALVVLALLAAWIGTEAVLAAVAAAPLLATPEALADAALRPTGTAVVVAPVVGALGVVLGVILVVLAVAPGRRHRTGIPAERGALVVDSRVVAVTAANAAARAADVPEDQVVASVGRHRTDVRIVPVSGVPVDTDNVQLAVSTRLAALDERLGRGVRVRVSDRGRLG